MLTIENKLVSKFSAVDQKVKNIPKEHRTQQEMPVAKKGKRNVTATAGESGASTAKHKQPGPTYKLSPIPMAISKIYI